MIKSASASDVIDPTTYKRFVHYAEVVGKPIKQVIDKALNRWMDDFGEVTLESYQQLAARHVKKTRIQKKIGNAIVFINQPDTDVTETPQVAAQGVGA